VGVASQVIKDVVEKVRNHFVNAGVDESVLHELRSEWEQELHTMGALGVGGDEAAAEVHPPLAKRARHAEKQADDGGGDLDAELEAELAAPGRSAPDIRAKEAAGVGAGGGEAAAQEDPGPAGEAGGDGDDSEGGLSEVELNQEADWPAEEVHDFLVASATEVKRPRSKTKKFQVT